MTEVEKPRKRASKAFDTDRFVAHVGIASAITSYSRCMMYPYMIDESVVYTDTDRLFTSKKLKSVGSNLGQFRLETEFVDAIFLAPRTYILKHQDGSLTRKMAGVPHEHQSLFSFEDFESCLTKGFQVTKTYFCAKERRSFIYTLEACDDTKRRKLYDSNNV